MTGVHPGPQAPLPIVSLADLDPSMWEGERKEGSVPQGLIGRIKTRRSRSERFWGHPMRSIFASSGI